MAVKKRKCKHCSEWREDFIKTNIAVFCDTDCAYKFAVAKQEKQQAKLFAELKRVSNKRIKAEKAAHRADKERIKPKSKWLAELQALVNKYVRLRDINDGCISCDKSFNWHGQYHAGHYFSRGHSSALRFNLWNLHKQCSVCNNHLSGNTGEYTPRLIEKIGKDKYNHLICNKSAVTSYDIEWIKRAIKIARKGIKRVEIKSHQGC
ncbi:MAG: recombination protein NinG [Pseudoalteromonas sp.]|uniref:recombination protein NinG n=1 Tax=Pseudoalteromonas sp. TaxID=53249 RepID=UPI001E15ADD1|nr:recombination protein NinG [Pseudoalteromonas sp.]NRA81189.1 recombination protein NinG [Pseudoalteromonas sp.]